MKNNYVPYDVVPEISFWQMTVRVAVLAVVSMAFISCFLLTINGIVGILG